jgi:hypothetical protein
VFSTALERAGDGPFSAFGRQQGRSCRTHPSGYGRPISRNGSQARQVTNIQPAHASWLSHPVIKKEIDNDCSCGNQRRRWRRGLR